MISSALLLIMALPVAAAQERPTRSIPRFTNDTSYRQRQNVCDRYTKYDRREVELRDALKGLKLRPLLRWNDYVLAGDSVSSTSDEDEFLHETYPGLVPVLLDEIARRGGFTWRDSYGISVGPREGENFTWTDYYAWSTEYFDVVGPWATRNLERLGRGMTFPEGFYDSSYILIGFTQSTEEPPINVWQWLAPFDPDVWMWIAITIVLSGIIFQVLDHIPARYKARYNQPSTNNARTCYGRSRAFGENFFFSSLLFTQHFQFMPRTTASRVFSVSMAFWALVISSNYTANLASFYVAENSQQMQIQSIEDAIIAEQPICVGEGSSIETFVTKTYPQAKLVPTPPYLSDSQKGVHKAIQDGLCPVGVSNLGSFEQFQLQRETNPNCDVEWIGRAIDFRPGGFAIKVDSGVLCTSLINDVFNLHLLEMKADGFIQQEWTKHLERNQDIDCNAIRSAQDTSANNGSRSMREMAGTFIFHFALAGVAFVVMGFSRILHHKKDMIESQRTERMRQSASYDYPKTMPKSPFLEEEYDARTEQVTGYEEVPLNDNVNAVDHTKKLPPTAADNNENISDEGVPMNYNVNVIYHAQKKQQISEGNNENIRSNSHLTNNGRSQLEFGARTERVTRPYDEGVPMNINVSTMDPSPPTEGNNENTRSNRHLTNNGISQLEGRIDNLEQKIDTIVNLLLWQPISVVTPAIDPKAKGARKSSKGTLI